MVQKKPTEVAELLDSIISTPDSLHAFLTRNTNANVSCSNHANIVRSVSTANAQTIHVSVALKRSRQTRSFRSQILHC